MIRIDFNLMPVDLSGQLQRFWELSGEKISAIEREYELGKGTPVFTVEGKYTTRGWTEWTQGFQFGSSILQFDATGGDEFLEKGRTKTLALMAPHVSHTGVHDHGFNNVSTYGNLLRLMVEGKTPFNEWEKNFYELALKVSGAVQASRWTPIKNGGFIYSFNGPHSLFVDTMRTIRILMLSHKLGHVLQQENDVKVNLLVRALQHARATADYSVFYGEGRDRYDLWGRTAHESIFNTNDGNFRSPNAQQGYTGFSTWTRGLAWAMVGFAEQLEFLDTVSDEDLAAYGSREGVAQFMRRAAEATCDFYIEHTPIDGIPYWDTGAPNLHKLGDYLSVPANPYNDFEPVDSSAAAIGAQGLLRLGNYLKNKGEQEKGTKYWQAGLTVLRSLLAEPYLSTDPDHQGIILHSIYHQPNGWDHIPAGQKIACGESSMWGDYHAREVALYVQRVIENKPYYTFYNGVL
ncbi:glycoside hydrolase family 88 protein [Parapedobacter indicus]|uniref:Glycosyl Hydrolase Family 88 n=1 Tax=Parapedobacter indicus TaxID=1477437 RepID=A0A1I3VBJ5_9SPHI|nr:glycoside hydrolase family 88 protein [Parapedobacter indicus]PPK98967.1 glycosyl hydrolase family 88 [Parapedobacter indicus]SFJ91557.1 Glycosyl Hydrolase Family 88 [Parapedobacter indicus]